MNCIIQYIVKDTNMRKNKIALSIYSHFRKTNPQDITAYREV